MLIHQIVFQIYRKITALHCLSNPVYQKIWYYIFAPFVLSEPRDEGSCSDISEVSMVVLSVSFQKPDNILEMYFGSMNE